MATIDPVKLRPGMKIVCDGGLWQVTEFNHRTPGNLRSFVVCKLKNLRDGRVVEKTFRGAADHPEKADFEQRTSQYLYQDEDGYHFMDTGNYEQFTLQEEDLGPQKDFLVAEMEVVASFFESRPVGVEMPAKVTLKVVDTIDAVRGNTATNMTKDAKLENGVVIQVPPFVKTGDKVIVNTETAEYVQRA